MNEQILAVQAMQDYIAAHLTEEVTAADLAAASHFSPWHAYRLFRMHTGLSPSDYIRRLRLSRSAMQLKRGDKRITDAAFEAGFNSVDGYTRAFYREFGCNPGGYAKNPVPISLFIPYGVKYRRDGSKEERNMNDVQSVIVTVVHKPARRAVIRRGVKAEHYMDYCNEVGCEVWGLLTSMDSLDDEPVCLWLPDAYRAPGTSVYVQGVEQALSAPKVVPEGFDVIELPEADYIRFQGEPFAEEDYEDAIRFLWQAMGRFDPARLGYVWDDTQPRIQLEPRGERGYIEMRAVKKK